MYTKHLTRRAHAVAVALAFSSAGSPVAAQVVLDGTTGPAGVLAGPDYAIGADLGRRAGGNLFHSFERFGLRTGERAGTVKLMREGMGKRRSSSEPRSYAAASAPVTSAQIAKARAQAARYSVAVR